MIRPMLAITLLVAVAASGCADDGSAEVAEDGTTAERGVIEGLLVDDRFRPIELTPGGGPTEFQAAGFILIAETGDELTTNANGEFRSAPLEPGSYTLRFIIEGHEAVPASVTVSAGDVTEATVVARRIATGSDVMIQQEYALFLACHVSIGVATSTGFGEFDCVLDRSGETQRSSFIMDFSVFPQATHVLTEVLLNKNAGSTLDGTFNLQIADKTAFVDNAGSSTDYNYALKRLQDGNYDSVLLTKNGDVPVFDYNELVLQSKVWDNAEPIIWNLYFNGQLTEVTDVVGTPQGIGPSFGTTGKFLITAMLDADQPTAESTCFLCS